MWTLEQGVAVVRDLQRPMRDFDYHVVIGGGVVNKGQSDKDLDLYFIPFSEQKPNPTGVLAYLASIWGTAYNLGGPSVRPEHVHLAYPDEPTWVGGRYTFWPAYGLGSVGDIRRIDVFIA